MLKEILERLGVSRIDGKFIGVPMKNAVYIKDMDCIFIIFTETGYTNPFLFPCGGILMATEHTGPTPTLMEVLLSDSQQIVPVPVGSYNGVTYNLRYMSKLAINIGIERYGRSTRLLSSWSAIHAEKGSVIRIKPELSVAKTPLPEFIDMTGIIDDGSDLSDEEKTAMAEYRKSKA